MGSINSIKNIIGGSKDISSVTSTSMKNISGICQGSSTGLRGSYIRKGGLSCKAGHLRAVTLRRQTQMHTTNYFIAPRSAEQEKNMRQSTKKKEEQTLFEKAGVAYEKRGDCYYPVLTKSDIKNVSEAGKYGLLWMKMLFESDRQSYHKLMLAGELVDKAIEFQEYACDVEADIVNDYVSNYLFSGTDDYMAMVHRDMQAIEIATEIIMHDAYVTMEKNKELRFEQAKERVQGE